MAGRQRPVFLTERTAIVTMHEGAPTLVLVSPDTDCPDPRREWENLGRFVIWSRRHRSPDPEMSLDEVAEACGIDDFCEDDPDQSDWWNGLSDPVVTIARRANELGVVRAQVVSAHVHSGTTYRCGLPTQFDDYPWDAAVAGIIWADVKEAAEILDLADAPRSELIARIDDELAEEVRVWNAWSAGDTWSATAYDANGDRIVTYDATLIGTDTDDTGLSDTFTEILAETELDDPTEFAEVIGGPWRASKGAEDFARRMEALVKDSPGAASRPFWAK